MNTHASRLLQADVTTPDDNPPRQKLSSGMMFLRGGRAASFLAAMARWQDRALDGNLSLASCDGFKAGLLIQEKYERTFVVHGTHPRVALPSLRYGVLW